MFLSSKLVGITTAVLTSGTASSVLIPLLKSSNWANWFYKTDSSQQEFNLKELDETAKANLEKLRELFKKFSSAENATKLLKKIEFLKIEALFQTIARTEEELKKLFGQITNSIADLLNKSQQQHNVSIDQLKEQKQENLQKAIWGSTFSLQEALTELENYLQKISCAITNERGQMNCEELRKKTYPLINSLLNIPSFLPSIETDSISSPKKVVSLKNTGAEKARQDLIAIQEALTKIIQDIQIRNEIYDLERLHALSQEEAALLKHKEHSELFQDFSKKIERLISDITKDDRKSTEISKKIIDLKNTLKNSNTRHADLQKQENIFHRWTETIQEGMRKNQNDLKREIQPRN